ncbi:MAG: LCP family protein [Actinomycetota bacterium]
MAPGTSTRAFFGRLAIASVAVVAATSAGVTFGTSRFEDSVQDIETVEIEEGVLAPQEEGEPANFLIIGSDSREFVDNEADAQAFGSADEVGGARSDTTMVVHVEPETRTGFVVSFPRDLRVEIPGFGEQKLNAAFSIGGPSLVIETLRENYDVPIHHYLEVDFAGFEEIVDTIGGVDIQFNAPARDRFSQLDIPEAGCWELDGRQALQYVRSRHYQYYDAERDRWREDPTADLNRIKRQQYFMRSLADAALDIGAGDLRTAFRLLDDVVDSLRRDAALDVGDMRGLINAFRDLDPASIEMTTIPIVDDGADLVLKEPDAAPVLDRLRNFGFPEGFEPPADPADTRVIVRNGSGVGGRGGQVFEALAAYGYAMVGRAQDADRDDYPLTEVRYAVGTVQKGLTVATALGTLAVAEARDLPADVDVEVIVGRDWDEIPAPVKEAPPETRAARAARATGVPPTANDASGAAASTAPSTSNTTTTVPSLADTALVPVDPETGGALVGCP